MGSTSPEPMQYRQRHASTGSASSGFVAQPRPVHPRSRPRRPRRLADRIRRARPAHRAADRGRPARHPARQGRWPRAWRSRRCRTAWTSPGRSTAWTAATRCSCPRSRPAAGSASTSSPGSPTSCWCPTRPRSGCCRGPTGPAGCSATCTSPTAQPMPLDGRGLMRRMLGELGEAGYDYLAGIEVEYYIVRLGADPRHAGERRVHPAATAGQRLGARLPVPLRGPAGQRGQHAGGDPGRAGRGRAAAPLDGGRVGPGPDGVQLQPDRRACRGGRRGVVPFCGQADLPAPRACSRPSCAGPALPNFFSSGWHLHESLLSPAGRAQRVRQRGRLPVGGPAGSSWPACSSTRYR